MPEALRDSRSRRLWTALLLALLLGACAREQPVYQNRLLVFGSFVDLTLYGVTEAEGAQASRLLLQQMSRQQRDWSPREDGELARLNAALATGETMEVSAEMLELLSRGQRFFAATDGLLNPAIGRLIDLWGFGRSDQEPPRRPPEPAAIRQVVEAAPRMTDLRLEGRSVRSVNPAVKLDFGALAEAVAAESAVATLRSLGIENAIINMSGDIKVIGRRGDRNWRVGIRNPRGEGILAAVELADGESVFTSGDYERFFEYEGRRYHHILDPRTGYPSEGLVSVTVIHDDPAVANAGTTAMLVAGPERWPETARALGIDQVMAIDRDGLVHLTPAMARRLTFLAEPPPPTRIHTP